jgi:hypothetical protein
MLFLISLIFYFTTEFCIVCSKYSNCECGVNGLVSVSATDAESDLQMLIIDGNGSTTFSLCRQLAFEPHRNLQPGHLINTPCPFNCTGEGNIKGRIVMRYHCRDWAHIRCSNLEVIHHYSFLLIVLLIIAYTYSLKFSVYVSPIFCKATIQPASYVVPSYKCIS